MRRGLLGVCCLASYQGSQSSFQYSPGTLVLLKHKALPLCSTCTRTPSRWLDPTDLIAGPGRLSDGPAFRDRV